MKMKAVMGNLELRSPITAFYSFAVYYLHYDFFKCESAQKSARERHLGQGEICSESQV